MIAVTPVGDSVRARADGGNDAASLRLELRHNNNSYRHNRLLLWRLA